MSDFENPPECEMCGDPLNHGTRFCSRDCYDEWQREERELPKKPMTFEEMQAEMEGVFARLRAAGEIE